MYCNMFLYCSLLFYQITTEGTPLSANLWYTVTLEQLSQGQDAFSVSVNGIPVSFNATDYSRVNFDLFNGPLYIGGHPTLSAIQV